MIAIRSETCTCDRSRGDHEGFTRRGPLWVHAVCGRPTAAFLEGFLRRSAEEKPQHEETDS